MSGRGRRGRGRPPKRAAISHRINLLKKPRYLYAGSGHPRLKPESGGGSPSRRGQHVFYRGRLREKARSSFFSSSGLLDDEMDERLSSDDSDYQRDEEDEAAALSDASFPESDELSVYSEQSSVGGAPRRPRPLALRRPGTPVFLSERAFPPLELPPSSDDLPIGRGDLLRALGVYEVLRHFRHILRLSPFLLEEWCGALASPDTSALLCDVHVALLRAILREEDVQGSLLAPLDVRDSVGVAVHLLDCMTWPAVLGAYLRSDPEFAPVERAVGGCEYPFASMEARLAVLEFLCEGFLGSAGVRDDLVAEGVLFHDDHCRACHKLGDLLCCETCPAVFHLACLDPPLRDVPTEDWTCSVCRANQLSGVTDCISEIEKNMLLSRQECLGLDRHGRKYWFLCRRIVV